MTPSLGQERRMQDGRGGATREERSQRTSTTRVSTSNMPQTAMHAAVFRIDEEIAAAIMELGNQSGRKMVLQVLELIQKGKTREEALAEATGPLDYSWRFMDIISDMFAALPEGSDSSLKLE